MYQIDQDKANNIFAMLSDELQSLSRRIAHQETILRVMPNAKHIDRRIIDFLAPQFPGRRLVYRIGYGKNYRGICILAPTTDGCGAKSEGEIVLARVRGGWRFDRAALVADIEHDRAKLSEYAAAIDNVTEYIMQYNAAVAQYTAARDNMISIPGIYDVLSSL